MLERMLAYSMSISSEFVENGHILVVDDHQEICELIQEYLTEEGFRVSTAKDSAGFREEMARSRIDLVDRRAHV